MALQLERSVSLLDLRKEQRRVSALITLSDVSPELLRFPLRKKVLPQGFCYVCSRIDPGGIFRNQNSWLFQKGFFHACEHFPQAPQPTFVADEINVDRNETSTVTETVAPSISVTIKHERDSEKFGTPIRKERVPISRRSLNKNEHERDRITPTVKSSGRFPPISGTNQERLSKTDSKSRVHSELTLKARTLSSIELRSPGGRSKRTETTKTVQSAHETFSNYGTDRVTVIPTALDDDVTRSDDKSDFSATPREGVDVSTNTNKHGGSANVGGAEVDDSNEAPPFINKSDGLGSVYSVEPLIKEVVSLEDGRKWRRLTGRRGKDKHTDSDTDTLTDRPESGHLRYHHRSEEDSVPDPGFEIPPTPSVEERLQLEREEQARKEAERREIEREIALGNVFVDESIDGEHVDSISDDASLRLTDGRSVKSSKHIVRGPLSTSSMRSFCRCPSETRETSFMKSTCLICGKGIVYGNSRRSRESSISQNEAVAPSMRSPGTVSIQSRQRMLNASKQFTKGNEIAKSVSDEDYMDLESIIYEDDGRYWSSDDDEYEMEYMTRSAMYRYKNAKPFPLVDPDLHKLVYIKALREAHLKSFMSPEDEFDTLDKLRHPHTFSYFPLLPDPRQQRGEPSYLGLRPSEDEVQIKKGQFMRHIFGDVDFEKFYRKSSKKVRKHSLLDVTNTALIAKDRVSTEQSRSSPRTMANVPKEDERTSVSLKMRKPGVNFGKDS